MNAIDVRRIRAELGLSQSEFADLLGVSARTVQDWEQGRNQPGSPAAALLRLADSGALKRRNTNRTAASAAAKVP